MNQDPLFFKIQSIFFKIQLRQVTCEILISAAELMFLCMYALGVHSSFCCWLIYTVRLYSESQRKSMFCRIGSGKNIGIFKRKSGKTGVILTKVWGLCQKNSV